MTTAKGGVTVGADGRFVYTPTAAARHAAAKSGALAADKADVFTVTAVDGFGGSVAIPVSVTIVPVNAVPVAGVSVSTTNAGTGVVSGSVSATDADLDGVTFTGSVTTAKGGVTVGADGRFVYTPTAAARHAAAKSGATVADTTDSFTVTLADGYGGTAAAVINVAIIPANAAPGAGTIRMGVADPATGVITGSVAAIDADGDALIFNGSATTTAGAVVVNADGSFTYTPTAAARKAAANNNGWAPDLTDSFAVTAADGYGGAVRLAVVVAVAPTPDFDPNDVGYDVIVLAGQSNMQGSGLPFDTTLDPADPRVWQYAASGKYLRQIIPASDPLAMPVVGAGVGPGFTFGRLYASSASPNRRVLLVPSAVGGTPLVSTISPTWNSSVPNSLYAQMLSLTQGAVAAAGPHARVVAVLWIQGETDAVSRVSAADYQSAFDALVGKLRTDLNSPNLPLVVGQMLPDMLPRIYQTRTEINRVHATVGSRLPNAAFAPGPFGYVGDVFHYTAAGQRILAGSMFDAYRRIVAGVADPALPNAPARPTGVTVSPSTGATYTVSWSPVAGAGGYYIDRAATANGEYSLVTTTTGTSALVTRLSPTATEFIRIRAVNVVGGGPTSTPVEAVIAATPTTPGAAAVVGLGAAAASSGPFLIRAHRVALVP